MPRRLDNGVERNLPLWRIAAVLPAGKPAAEHQVLPHGEMRKEPRILVDDAEPSLVLGHENPLFGIDQHAAVDHDGAAIGLQQAGDEGNRHRLAGARTANQGKHGGIALERNIEAEGAERDSGVKADHPYCASRRLAMRAITSDSTSAPSAVQSMTAVSRHAEKHRPRHLRIGEDRRRNGPRLARDVGHGYG